MGNSRDLAFDAATPSMILRVHHDYPLSLCMCICKYDHQGGRTGGYTALVFFFFCGQVYAGSRTSGSRTGRLVSRPVCHWLPVTQPIRPSCVGNPTDHVSHSFSYFSLLIYRSRCTLSFINLCIFVHLCPWASCTTSAPDIPPGPGVPHAEPRQFWASVAPYDD